MKRNPIVVLFVLVLVFVVFYVLFSRGCESMFFKEKTVSILKPSILVLELKGIILDSKKFLERIDDYKDNPNIKAIVIRIDSPGGSVAPSEEIYQGLQLVRHTFEKPVVVSSGSLLASGAYYIASAADYVYVNRGTMMGSIGVMMQFANLEHLYNWAKIQRYVLKTGKYKDSGSEHRSMGDDEKELFQNMIDEVLLQFKEAVSNGRGDKLDKLVLDQNSDGRVFTGDAGVRLGFADAIGVFSDAVKKAAELAGLGENYEIFTPPKKKPSFFDLLFFSVDEDWDDYTSRFWGSFFFSSKLSGRPLLIMPGVF